MNKIFACIDLKSFFASVECVLRNLDPLDTNLVVADNSRTDKTVCLAITPSLKQYGLGGRARLYEVKKTINTVNETRKVNTDNYLFCGKSFSNKELEENDNLQLDYIIAPPRMAYYMKYSTKIYDIYLKYISSEDIYSYSIDEVFIDLTSYLNYYKKSPEEIITNIIKDVYDNTGITATAGIGTNMYLAKIAMDIIAKKSAANSFGVRIASLDEEKYRQQLWEHEPITDFWQIGAGYQRRLAKYSLFTMGDIAKLSLTNEDILYQEFGINAELLIDHAWGYESATIESVKQIKPASKSISSGQVLHEAYNYTDTKIIIKEMCELLSLELKRKKYVTNQIVLHINYDKDNLINPKCAPYVEEITTDLYGRSVPKPAHGTIRTSHKTSSTKVLINNVVVLYDKIINKNLLVRKVNITFGNLLKEDIASNEVNYHQLDLWGSYEEKLKQKETELREQKLSQTIIDIKLKYGKNAIIKGMNLLDKATTTHRNSQIGGHKA